MSRRPIQPKTFNNESFNVLDEVCDRSDTIARSSITSVYATIHTRHLTALNSSPSGAPRHPPFPRGDTDERGDFSARARSGTRGGVRVAFGMQSTMEHRSPNGSARGKSRAKVLVDPPAAPIGNRCRLSSSRGARARSQLWRYANATLTVSHAEGACACDCQGGDRWPPGFRGLTHLPGHVPGCLQLFSTDHSRLHRTHNGTVRLSPSCGVAHGCALPAYPSTLVLTVLGNGMCMPAARSKS